MDQDTAIESPADRRIAEREAFANVTEGLKHAAEQDDTGKHQALMTNRVFWGVLKDNLFSDENKLTADVKGQIFTLASWIEGYTDKVMRGDADEIRPLISINATIMAGLV